MPADAATVRPKLIYLVTEDWYFWSHRLPMARAARDAGFAVGVATRVADHGERIAAEGFQLHPLDWRRRRLDPAETARALNQIVRLYRSERPDLVHHVALKPVLLGSLAAAWARVPAVVNAPTGLGTLFVADTLPARLLRAALRPVLGHLLNRRNGRVVVQNLDDRDALIRAGLVRAERGIVVRGSGVDTERFRPLPEPPEPPVVAAYVGRMLALKGLRTLVAAHRLLREQGRDIHLVLAGAPDSESPTCIPVSELRAWAGEPGIRWLGSVADVRTVWAGAHLAVQASLGGEGLPLSLLEAAACGRAIVATDVPGCREIARGGENALLVPPDDPAALARALDHLARDAALRQRFAAASRRMVESDLAAARVGERTVGLYRDLLIELDPQRYGTLRTPQAA